MNLVGDQKIEVLLPFLIVAQEENGQLVDVFNKRFDARANVIILEVGLEFENKNFTALFPNCSGLYSL